ncbi:MAG: hypothetical protein JXX14_17955 [Deltaproteobacteria bacterium]|nr:hypothetical protein [Deltaproteobacteria bacterium]
MNVTRPANKLPVRAWARSAGICLLSLIAGMGAGCGKGKVMPGDDAPVESPLHEGRSPVATLSQKGAAESKGQMVAKKRSPAQTLGKASSDAAPDTEALNEMPRTKERERWEERLSGAGFRQVKPLSSRSLSLRLIFPGGESAIFKPLLQGDSSGRLEVAYYRLATLLGVETVPVSVMTAVYPDRIDRALAAQGDEVSKQFLESVALDEKGRVWGAMIQWLEGLAPIGAEDARGRLDVVRLFSDERYRPLQRYLSDTVLLDYLLGNWDRFSGGNLYRFSNRPGLALIDHNEAFYRLNERQQQMLEDSLNAVPCVSAELAQKMRGLTAEKLKSAVEQTKWPGELLRPGEIRNILIRKDTLLAFIDSRVAESNGSDSWACR